MVRNGGIRGPETVIFEHVDNSFPIRDIIVDSRLCDMFLEHRSNVAKCSLPRYPWRHITEYRFIHPTPLEAKCELPRRIMVGTFPKYCPIYTITIDLFDPSRQERMVGLHSSRCEVGSVAGKQLGLGSRDNGISHSSGQNWRMLAGGRYLFIVGVGDIRLLDFSFNSLSCEKS